MITPTHTHTHKCKTCEQALWRATLCVWNARICDHSTRIPHTHINANIVRRHSGELVCLHDTPECEKILEESVEVRGLVEDGKVWLHMGAVYECMRGVKVMMARHYARNSKYMQHAYAYTDDGERYYVHV